MAKIVWIASYPRSGNTWVRFLLANLLYGPVPSSAALNNVIPDIHRDFAGGQLHGNRKLLIKTHWRYDPALPLREDTIGLIYILRDPIDVLASNLDYQMIRSARFLEQPTEAALAETVRRWIDDYIAHGGDPALQQLGIGNWIENVASWTEAPLPYPRLVLRYEDLLAATQPNLAKIAAFLGVAADAARLADAVRRSSFEAMRALEEREIQSRDAGIFYSPILEAGIAKGHRFIRRGQIGGQEDRLTPLQRKLARERFGAAMARFGYAERDAQAAPSVDR
jgi:Sulfotransferase domain